ncbi:MAG: ribbon-helix-helix protein, CopG family [Bryobacteraceae bacterium]
MSNLTIELPEELARRLESMAAARHTTVPEFVVDGLTKLVADRDSRPGSPASILRAIAEVPLVSAADADDLDAAISRGVCRFVEGMCSRTRTRG